MFHLFYSTILLLINLYKSQVTEPYTGFTYGSPNMQYAQSTLFTGYQSSTDRIWLIGGPQELIMSYEIGTNTMTYWGYFSAIELNVNSINSQSYVQWGDNDIMFTHDGILRSFNFGTWQVSSYQPLTYNRQAPCVAAIYPNYILAVGGIITLSADPENVVKDDSKYLQIYDYAKSTWSQGPNMLYGRSKHACVIHNNYLYAFGGEYYNTDDLLYYIRPYSEKLYVGDVANINSYPWQTIAYIANSNVFFHRAVVHALYNHIYLIGGRDSNIGGRTPSRKIQIYDIDNDIMELDGHGGELIIGRSSPAAIIVNNILYVFGGTDNTGYDQLTWEKSNILTFSPTPSPTPAPTHIPTNMPTKFPTNMPSKMPTNLPSISPSKYPTNIPTILPSDSPTVWTIIPTSMPTMEPTYVPSEYPTLAPSNTPTKSPETGLHVLEPSNTRTVFNGVSSVAPTVGMIETIMNTMDENGSNIIINNEPTNIGYGAIFYIILIVIIILFIICILLVCFVLHRHRRMKRIAMLQNESRKIVNLKSESSGIEMMKPNNITMSDKSSDNNSIIDTIKLTPGDLERVASMSNGINMNMNTPFGDLGDLLDDNNHIYNKNSELQKVMSMSSHPSQNHNDEQYNDDDDEMYKKGNNDDYNIQLQTQGNTNGAFNDNDNDNDESDEGTNTDLSDKSDNDSILYGNKDTIKTTQGALTVS